uniref:EGF-like domain-containing protein n=1 Tax=Anguilla anguilla TaxID=7936 RepID=A0A0E9RWT7_ANGAN
MFPGHSNCTSTSCGPNAVCISDGGCVCVPGYGVPVNALPTPESLCFGKYAHSVNL